MSGASLETRPNCTFSVRRRSARFHQCFGKAAKRSSVSISSFLLPQSPKQSTAVKLSVLGLGSTISTSPPPQRHGIPVSNTPDYGTTDVADHAIALVLALTRGITAYNDILRKDGAAGLGFPACADSAARSPGWSSASSVSAASAPPRPFAPRHFGMDVVFYDPYRPSGTELALGLRRVDRSRELLRRADILSMHTPLTERNRIA